MQGVNYALCLILLADPVEKKSSGAIPDSETNLGAASETSFNDFIDGLPDEPEKPRIPPAAVGIQINFCKNPGCKNFGIPASQEATRGSAARVKRNLYTVVASGKNYPHLRCDEHFPIKSNVGIDEEARRLENILYFV